jgi:CheY-like chemotaxis protein
MPRLLLVDDVDAARAIARLYLRDLDIEVDEAGDGARAVELFCGGSYFLVLLDLEMPVLHGLEACRAMRAAEAAENRARTTILALTAHEDAAHAQACLAAGCDGVLVKPLNRTLLRATVTSHLPG